MEENVSMSEESKQKIKEAGFSIFDGLLKAVGIVGYSFFLMFRGVFNVIITFIVGGIGLYIFLGIIGVILCHVFAAMGHAYLGH